MLLYIVCRNQLTCQLGRLSRDWKEVKLDLSDSGLVPTYITVHQRLH